MAEKVTELFDTLMNLSGRFVESQKGAWNHTAWLDFLAGLRKKGFELTDTMKTYVGSVMESMKKVYEASIATKRMEELISDIADQTVSFMKNTKGVWDQKEWESYLKDLQEKGIGLTDETRNYLGGVLEAARELYTIIPPLSKEEAPPVVKEEAPPLSKEEAPPVAKEEAPPLSKEEASPVAKEEAPPVAKEEASPVAKEEASPVAKEEAPPVSKKEAPPVSKKEAPPVSKKEAPPVSKKEAPKRKP
jgi:hypothetical protein